MKSVVTAERTIIPEKKSSLTAWFESLHPFWFTLVISFTAFGLYTCVYAFRKSFAAATFSGQTLLGIDFKVWLVVAQVIGYAISKFVGIKIISELPASGRKHGIFVIACISGLSWLFFALLPAPYNIACLLINGLTLGMVWGMVFGYLEGRSVTEVLGSALSISFIFSSGLCRSVGASIMVNWNVSETWMPWIVSCIFFVPLMIFLNILDRIPPPTKEDEALRTKRSPMNGSERKKFLATFLPGIVLFVLAYILLTAFRDFRDNFSAEIWTALGYGNSPGIYTSTEVPVAIGVFIVMGSLMVIRNNRVALMINHFVILSGMILIGASTYLFHQQQINPATWMILIGLGLYFGYVPFNSIFFERLLASFQYIGTVGFIMYVADAFGYLGSVGVLFVKEFWSKDISWLDFFITAGYVVSVIGAILTLGSMLYFFRKQQHWNLQAGVK